MGMTRRGPSRNGTCSERSTSEPRIQVLEFSASRLLISDEEEGEGGEEEEVGAGGLDDKDDEEGDFPERNVLGKINK